MKVTDIREKIIRFTDEILISFAEDVFVETRMSSSWNQEVRKFVEENHRAHRGNYERLYRLFQNSDGQIALRQIDIDSLATILQFFPPIKELYKKTSARSANESFEKTVKDISVLRNALDTYDAAYDRESKRLYFMQFNQLINLQRLALMCIEHFDNSAYWLDVLDWAEANILEQKLSLE